jgi:hypothetical protein
MENTENMIRLWILSIRWEHDISICPTIMSYGLDARKQLTKRKLSRVLQPSTMVRTGDFGRDAQFSLTYGRMCLFRRSC